MGLQNLQERTHAVSQIRTIMFVCNASDRIDVSCDASTDPSCIKPTAPDSQPVRTQHRSKSPTAARPIALAHSALSTHSSLRWHYRYDEFAIVRSRPVAAVLIRFHPAHSTQLLSYLGLRGVLAVRCRPAVLSELVHPRCRSMADSNSLSASLRCGACCRTKNKPGGGGDPPGAVSRTGSIDASRR